MMPTCDDSATVGCEVDVRNDAENCGMCDRRCNNGQTCMSGSCR